VAFASSASFDPADGDVQSDVYVRDITSNTTFLASRQNGANGPGVNADAADPAISGDGNRVAFVTTGNHLLPSIFDPNGVSDVYVRDLAAGTTVVGSARTGAPAAGNGMSMSASLDATGTHLAFASAATDLAPGVDGNGTSDVFLRDLGASTTTLVSRGASTAAGNDTSLRPSISADAQRIAFESAATDLVPGDVDAATDVFVRDRAAATTTLVSRADGAAGAPAARGAGNASMSADGHCVAFDSDDDALVAGTVGSDFTRGYVRALDGICGAPPAQEPPAGADPGTGGGGGGGVGTPPGSGGPLADRTAPALSAVALSNRRFRVGGKATATIAAAKRATAPTGTTIRFTLSEAATVTLSVERPLKGRMKGARCLTGRAAPSKGKRCTTYRAEGALRRGAAKGPKSVVFSGRIGRTALVTGAHRLTLLAIDAAGNRSPVKRIAFTIVRR
jgi:Tol biopolymer transport system component